MSELTPESFRKARFNWTLENQGGGTVEIDLTEEQAAGFTQPQRLIIRGERDWAGEILNLKRSGKPNEIGLPGSTVGWTASGIGLFHRLDYRIVRHDLAINDTADVIVEALLSEAQDNQFNGGMGMQMGSVSGTPYSRNRSYCVGVNIGDAIRELADQGRGFDHEIDADGNLNIWYGSRGVDTGRTLSETQCQSFDIELDTSELLTQVTAIADPSDPFGPRFHMSNIFENGHFLAFFYGRREVAIDTDIIANTHNNPDWEDELRAAGHGLLKQYRGGALTLHAMWTSNKAPWSMGDVWLGDIVSVELPDVFGGTQDMRVTDVTVTLEAMPPRGAQPPVYWIEYNFDALVTDLAVIDEDLDEAS